MKSLLIILALCLGCTTSWAEWTAKEDVRDGVTYVTNPETPRDGDVRLDLEELWRLGGEDDEAVLFGVIQQIVADETGNIYVLDGQLSQIQVFLSDGEHRRSIGREGEGPGEFRNATDMYLGPNGVLGTIQIFPGKVVQLTTDGDPAGNLPLPEIPGGGYQLVYHVRANSERLVLAGAVTRVENDESMQVKYLKAFDRHGTELARYHDVAHPSRYGGMQFQERHWTDFQDRWALATDGRVAAGLSFDEYRIHVWNTDGSIERVIERPGYQRIRRSATEKKRFQRMYDALTRWSPGSSFSVSETHETISQMFFREDGRLWVLSSAGIWQRDPGVFAHLDVYDARGIFAQRIQLVAPHDIVEDGMFLIGDRVYVVTDFFSSWMAGLGGDEAEEVATDVQPTSLIAYQMRGATIGMK